MNENQEYDPMTALSETSATANRLTAEIKALVAEMNVAHQANRRAYGGVVAAVVKQGRPMIPRTVTRGQLAKACTAFCDALGFNPAGAAFPLIVTEHAVTFPAYPVAAEDGPKPPKRLPSRYKLSSPQEAHLSSVLTTMVTLEVVDQ